MGWGVIAQGWPEIQDGERSWKARTSNDTATLALWGIPFPIYSPQVFFSVQKPAFLCKMTGSIETSKKRLKGPFMAPMSRFSLVGPEGFEPPTNRL